MTDRDFETDIANIIRSLASIFASAGLDPNQVVSQFRNEFEKAISQTNVSNTGPAWLTATQRSYLSSILATWHRSPPPFTDPVTGEAAPLSIDGDDCEFQVLVERAAKRVETPSPPISVELVLKYFLDSGSIKFSENRKSIIPTQEAFDFSNRGEPEPLLQIAFLSDFISTIEAAITRPGSRMTHMVARTPLVPISSEAKLKQLTREQGLQFLQTIDAAMTFESDASDCPNDRKQPMGAGVYFFSRRDEHLENSTGDSSD